MAMLKEERKIMSMKLRDLDRERKAIAATIVYLGNRLDTVKKDIKRLEDALNR